MSVAGNVFLNQRDANANANPWEAATRDTPKIRAPCWPDNVEKPS